MTVPASRFRASDQVFSERSTHFHGQVDVKDRPS